MYSSNVIIVLLLFLIALSHMRDFDVHDDQLKAITFQKNMMLFFLLLDFSFLSSSICIRLFVLCVRNILKQEKREEKNARSRSIQLKVTLNMESMRILNQFT